MDRMRKLDEYGRKLLSSLEPPAGAADRLSKKIVAVESWVEQAEQSQETRPSGARLRRLTPAMDVVGHGLPAKQKADRNKKPARARASKRKARKRSKKSPKRK